MQQGIPVDERLVACLLIGGCLAFLAGAAFWKPKEYQQALPRALAAMAVSAARMRWIQSWMIVGVVTTTLGIVLLARFLGQRGEVVCSTLGATLFALGASSMLVFLAFGLTVRIWAAAECAASGEVPVGYEALDRWAALLYAIHMVTAYSAWALLGTALVRSGAAPAWVGWSGVGAGSAMAVGFVVLRGGPFAPPILVHAYPLMIGISLLLQSDLPPTVPRTP